MLKSIERKPVTYVGYTISLKNRIKLHNAGKGAKFTRGRKWKLIYKEKVISKKEAILRIDPNTLDTLLHPTLDNKVEKKVIAFLGDTSILKSC